MLCWIYPDFWKGWVRSDLWFPEKNWFIGGEEFSSSSSASFSFCYFFMPPSFPSFFHLPKMLSYLLFRTTGNFSIDFGEFLYFCFGTLVFVIVYSDWLELETLRNLKFSMIWNPFLSHKKFPFKLGRIWAAGF